MRDAREPTPVSDPARRAPTAGTWEELAEAARSCIACSDLARWRTQVVPGSAPREGPSGAEVLLVGEAPGRQEDEAGMPFVGTAGRLLDELLADAGLDRQHIAVTNVVKCRPPANRKPSRAELDTCSPWLDRQLTLVDPTVVCVLGGTAAEWALGRPARIREVRGTVLDEDGRSVVVTYHPSAAVRFGPQGTPRAGLSEDLRLVAKLVGKR